jgi:hypothetical protein
MLPRPEGLKGTILRFRKNIFSVGRTIPEAANCNAENFSRKRNLKEAIASERLNIFSYIYICKTPTDHHAQQLRMCVSLGAQNTLKTFELELSTL